MKDDNYSSAAPEGWPTVTPRIVVHDAEEFVALQISGGSPRNQDDVRHTLESLAKLRVVNAEGVG